MADIHTFIDELSSLASGPMLESVSRAYRAIFEATSTERALAKCREQIRATLHIPNTPDGKAKSQQIMHLIVHCFLDMFANTPSRDTLKLPEVQSICRFLPGITALALGMHIYTGEGENRCRQLAPKLKTYITKYMGQLDANLRMPGDTEINTGRIDSMPPTRLNLPLQYDASEGHSYSIIHIPDHKTAMEYSSKVPWCLTYDDIRYWTDYSNEGQFKCYFIFRDDIDEMYKTSMIPPSNPDDEYGRTAIGIFIGPDGSIEHLFNRWNNFEFIYGEHAMSQLIGRPIREACPPYTEDEAAEGHARWEQETTESEGYSIPDHIDQDNIIDVMNDLLAAHADDVYEYQMSEMLYELPGISYECEDLSDGHSIAMVKITNGGVSNIIINDGSQIYELGIWTVAEGAVSIVSDNGEIVYSVLGDSGNIEIYTTLNDPSGDPVYTCPGNCQVKVTQEDQPGYIYGFTARIFNPDHTGRNIVYINEHRVHAAVPPDMESQIQLTSARYIDEPLSGNYAFVLYTPDYVYYRSVGAEDYTVKLYRNGSIPANLVPASTPCAHGPLSGFIMFTDINRPENYNESEYVFLINPETGKTFNTKPWICSSGYSSTWINSDNGGKVYEDYISFEAVNGINEFHLNLSNMQMYTSDNRENIGRDECESAGLTDWAMAQQHFDEVPLWEQFRQSTETSQENQAWNI